MRAMHAADFIAKRRMALVECPMSAAFRSIATSRTDKRRPQTPPVCQVAADDIDYGHLPVRNIARTYNVSDSTISCLTVYPIANNRTRSG
jgi:hypothetical protein